MFRLLSILLFAAAALAQSPAVTYTYNGFTDCRYAAAFILVQPIPGSLPRQVLAFINGQVRLNVGAGVDQTPVAPITPGFVTGGPAVAYPVTSINGTLSITIPNGPRYNASVLGVIQPAYLYMDIGNGANAATGFDRDPDFAFFMDTRGLRLTTDNSSRPELNLYLDGPRNERQYAETTLIAEGLPTGTFLLSECTTNTFTITRTVVNPPASSTGTSGPGGAVGDPSFSGFRGQRYQIHGVSDTVYNIITDANLVLNAEFVFLTRGECPILDGKPMTNCWSHPGSYFGSLGLKTINGDEVIIQSGVAKKGFELIQFNKQVITAPTTLTGLSGANEAITLQVHNTHQMTLNTGLFEFELENSDNFINIVTARVTDWRALTHSVKSHGLLGQTWELRKGIIQGTVDDYAEASNNLLGHDFLYNKFQPKSQ